MNSTRNFAFYGGIAMIAIGILAMIPALSDMTAQANFPLLLNVNYGFFLGFFPMNILNKIALIGFGVAGILSAKSSMMSAVNYSRIVFVVMGLLAILGLFPATNTLFGYWPLFSGEIWAHGIVALIGAYYGFFASRTATERRIIQHA